MNNKDRKKKLAEHEAHVEGYNAGFWGLPANLSAMTSNPRAWGRGHLEGARARAGSLGIPEDTDPLRGEYVLLRGAIGPIPYVAKVLGIEARTIRRRESGHARVTPEHLLALRSIYWGLGIDGGRFLFEPGPDPQSSIGEAAKYEDANYTGGGGR